MHTDNITQKQNTNQRFSGYQRQTLAILQLSTQDFIRTIKDEYEKNPLIEFPDAYEYTATGSKSGFEDIAGSSSVDEYDIKDHLLSQLNNKRLSAKELSACKYLVLSIDRNGYLDQDLGELSSYFNASRSFILHVLRILRSLEPSGICARNLSESLMIQLLHLGERRLAIYKLIKYHLHDLAANKIQFISKSLGISMKQTKAFIAVIKSLNPRPGADSHAITRSEYIVPELTINFVNGEIDIQSNGSLYTPPSISAWYTTNIDSSQKEAYEFMKENLKRAKALIRAISDRRQTIQKVAGFLCSFQQEYLKNKDNPLKPISMLQVADSLNFHVSTISRAIYGKYIQTPHGTIALKALLSHHIADSDKISAHSVHQRLKQIINNEDKAAPYSDGELQKLLKLEGINLSKRTVTNYRLKLNLPSASGRKKLP